MTTPAQPPSVADGTPGQQAAGGAVPLWNIANILTIARLALVPVFAVLLLHADGRETWWRLAAAVVFMIASFTDRLDGELARRRHLITDFGKIADPIADKALMGAALICLSAQHQVWWWVTIVILVREIGITLMRFWVIKYGVIAASPGGKSKTAAQLLAIFLYLLPLQTAVDWAATVVMAVALALTVATGVDYIVRAVRLRAGAGR